MKVNFVERQIELTASEMKKAQNYGTREYTMIKGIRTDFPDFQIVVRKKKVTCSNWNTGLTYSYMEAFISHVDPAQMEIYQVMKAMYGYLRVAQWFKEQFPEALIPYAAYIPDAA